MPELLIRTANGATRRHPLGRVPQVIGRDAECDIAIDDPSASRRHARIVPGPHGYLVEDLGSKNGTIVNDRPCVSEPLQHGDRIVLGSTDITFHDQPDTPTGSVIIADDDTVDRATRYATREKELDLSRQRLKMIYELSERLTTLQGQETLLHDAMDICFEMLHFDRGAIGVRRETGRLVDWPVVRNLRGGQGELTISRTLLSRALEHGERAIFTPDDPASADPTMSIIQQGIRSAMCVPLMHNGRTLGVVYGDRIQSAVPYGKEDIDFFAGIAQQVSIGIVNARLAVEQQRMLRLTHDLDLARSIQNDLLPRALPGRDGLRVAALNEPGRRVSGDYYDVLELPDGRVWCLVADVTGEGVPAALLMANLQAVVRATIETSDDPAFLLGRWNHQVCRNTGRSRFITCVLMLIDPAKRMARCASAGHMSPWLLREGRSPEELPVDSGFPLGVSEDASFPVCDVALGSAPATLVTYTDGVIEAMNPAEELYGTDRLREVLAEVSGLPPAAAVKQIRKSVTQFVAQAAQSDDLTILAARVG